MRRAPLALTAGLSLLLVAACGGEDEASTPETDYAAGSEPTETGGSMEGAAGGSGADPGASGEAAVSTTFVDPAGEEVGTVEMDSTPEGTVVTVTASGLEPGFHGLHVHGVGLCEPDSQSPADPAMTGDFLSAGGHLGVDEGDHGSHSGDLPSLYVTEAGEAEMMFVTDGFTVDDITDADGSAVMVHSGADNFANVPERYAPEGPDQDTLDTGDSGTRVACAVVD
ncbi:superoxide dismutase family protein [uncultured Pseudokineococcus sp.]|uniref:superoxide dismutase family protein n=1 Tax=uncultured Pseudokineococcus sp. TaxID=1642928 RepID=UPI00261CB20E|nr:superoxide dismutase family protein [uncultured Pseudokineococcus sp.]